MRLVENLKAALTVVRTSGIEHNADGWWYPLSGSVSGDKEMIAEDFDGYVESAYKSNGIVFACVGVRLLAFSEARFQFQRLTSGRPGDLWGDKSLQILETPWPNGTTGDLLARAEQDVSLGGNFYVTPVDGGSRLRRMRPDWVTIISGVRGDKSASPWALDADILGYVYTPNGRADEAVLLSVDRVAHYAPIPDPTAQWRGMSWLTPIVREIEADSAMTRHRRHFFEKGALSNLVVTYDAGISPELFKTSVALFNEAHRGEANAYKTIHLGGGTDAKVLATDLKSIDFKAIQGAGETRIAAAAGVGPIIAQLSEGLQGSSLNAGNYNAAKRRFADMTVRPLWRSAAGSFAKLVKPPDGNRLWFDTRDIAFLKEDEKDAAEILSTQATTIRTLTDAGYTPESVIAAVRNSDFNLLQHSGLFSVQLQKAGTSQGGTA